jgi:hypothetical protein
MPSSNPTKLASVFDQGHNTTSGIFKPPALSLRDGVQVGGGQQRFAKACDRMALVVVVLNLQLQGVEDRVQLAEGLGRTEPSTS